MKMRQSSTWRSGRESKKTCLLWGAESTFRIREYSGKGCGSLVLRCITLLAMKSRIMGTLTLNRKWVGPYRFTERRLSSKSGLSNS